MIEVTVRAEAPEEIAETLRRLSGPDKMFVSASEVARAAEACGEPLSAPKHGERKAVG